MAAARADIQNGTPPLWQRLYADFVFLAIGAIVFWMVAKTGYQIVLAPEGVAQTSVHYEAFLAPLCLWVGAGLLWIRLSRLALGPGQSVVATVLRPMSAALAPIIAASLSRQQQRMAAGVALVALAFAFATATAIFNTTYNAQSRIDAELTNGADVTVTGTPAHPADALLQQLRAVPGVVTAEPMMHRFAYVGADLQDIFGINPAHIGKITTISNAYFANNNAAKTLALLAETTGRRSCLAGDGERFSVTTRRSFESCAFRARMTINTMLFRSSLLASPGNSQRLRKIRFWLRTPITLRARPAPTQPTWFYCEHREMQRPWRQPRVNWRHHRAI